MGKNLRNVRLNRSVKIGVPSERSMIDSKDVRSLQLVNDPELGHGVVYVDNRGTTRFIPSSNVTECELDTDSNVLAPEATRRTLSSRTA